MEEKFGRIVDAAARGGSLGDGVQATLDLIVERYPWFTTARLLREAAGGGEDASLRLHLQAFPRPSVMLGEVVLDKVDDPVEHFGQRGQNYAESRETTDVIERFLSLGDLRIVPAGDTTDENAAEASGTFVPTCDAVSEQLAGIYLAQGLFDEAKKIYEQLSLQNKKKSV